MIEIWKERFAHEPRELCGEIYRHIGAQSRSGGTCFMKMEQVGCFPVTKWFTDDVGRGRRSLNEDQSNVIASKTQKALGNEIWHVPYVGKTLF